MPHFLAEISDATWASIIISSTTLLTLVIKAVVDQFNRVQDRQDRALNAKLMMANFERSGTVRTEKVIAKINENITHTKDVKSALGDLEALRRIISSSKRPGSGDPVFFQVKLPRDTYEVFLLSEGSKVYWKSESCAKGRTVRFLVEGPCFMGFHFHKLAEIVSGVRGTMFYETSEDAVEITPGVVFVTPANTGHSARFDAPGEVTVHWPDQETDELEIGVWTPPAP